MADVTAYMGVDPALSDVRREAVEHASQIRRDVAYESGATREQVSTKTDLLNDAIKSSSWAVSDKIYDQAERGVAQATNYFIASTQQLSAHNTELAKVAAAQASGFTDLADRIATYSEINSLKAQQAVVNDGEKTRALINDLKNADLNRMLIERNSDVNFYRSEADRWEGYYGNGQFASLASQINALGSQLSETRQGLYNFGTMAGVGQSSTSNQVGG